MSDSAAEPPGSQASPAARKLRLDVLRQDAAGRVDTRRWESFEVEVQEHTTIADALEQLRRLRVTAGGQQVAPVAFEASCGAARCGACTLLANGSPVLACATRLGALSPRGKPVRLEPLPSFAVQRDLIVDRARMAHDRDRVASAPTLDPRGVEHRSLAASAFEPGDQLAHTLAACIACGACLAACPEYAEGRAFVGAAPLALGLVVDAAPVGRRTRTERIEAAMAAGGIADCGKAQSCEQACPLGLPLTDGLQRVAAATSRRWLLGWLLG